MTQAQRAAAFRRWPYCCIAMERRQMVVKPTEIHHARIHNLKWVRKRYPLFVDSLFNLRPVSADYHQMFPKWGAWPEWRVAQVERGLERHPAHAKEVNGG